MPPSPAQLKERLLKAIDEDYNVSLLLLLTTCFTFYKMRSVALQQLAHGRPNGRLTLRDIYEQPRFRSIV